MRYTTAAAAPVEWKATKYDECTLVATGKDYKHQKGSGRSTVLELARDGMTLKELAQKACAIGFTAEFAVDCAFKQHNTKDGAWTVAPPEGKTLAELKAVRVAKELTEEQKAKLAEKEKAKKEREAAKAAAKAQKEQEKADKAAAKAAGAAGSGDASGADAGPTKGKGKGKGKTAGGAAGASADAA